jgi:DNA modification methylase
MTAVREDYYEFIEAKVTVDRHYGIDPDEADLHPSLFSHQRDVERWALEKGRGLIALEFGLGKTTIQIDLGRIVHERTDAPVLIICPLGVKHQFIEEDGPRMGVELQYVRTDAEVEACETPYMVTNYERVRDGNIDPRKHGFAMVSLDEGSVLRSLGSKTYQVFEEVFADIEFKYVCTATPSPNAYRELIYYANWLGVVDNNYALTRWFQRDVNKAGNLTLHPQHEEEFWLWVSTWALFLYRPSDLGYSDEGYDLPELRVHWHRIPVDHRRAFERMDNRGQYRLLLDATASVSDQAAEKRATLPARMAKMREILAEHPDEHHLIWHHLEAERAAIEREVPEAVTIYGSQDLDGRERLILDFSHGKIRLMAPKPEIAGSGCNFQRHCHSNIFLGIDFKFQDFIQAIKRTHRFLQAHPVDVHIIYSESEDKVAETLKRKWRQHDRLTERMRRLIQQYGLNQKRIEESMKRTIGVTRQEVQGEMFTAVRNDCVLELPRIESDSVGLVHTSIPFGNHYEYTESLEDFGHNPTDDAFFEQMDFLIPELLRVLKPGRLAAIHVKDRVLYGYQTGHGFLEIDRFSDKTADRFEQHGFIFAGRRTIVTDVVRENASTYRLGWSEVCKDASKMGNGLPEYLLLFRKPPSSNEKQYADDPIVHEKEEYSRARWQVDAHSFWRSNGNALVGKQLFYDYHDHVSFLEERDAAGNLPAIFFADPPLSHSEWVWDDVTFMRCLNSEQRRKQLENHLCPLPLDIVERTINLYSNEGDLVLDPFAGLFTVPYLAVKMNRYGYGVELSGDYFESGVDYCRAAEREALAPTLFDWVALEAERIGAED